MVSGNSALARNQALSLKISTLANGSPPPQRDRSELSELLPVGFDMLRKQLAIQWVRDTVYVNLDSLFTEFRAEVNYLYTSTALDWHASWFLDYQFRYCPVVSMLNTVGLDRGVSGSRQQPAKCNTHRRIATL